MIGILSAKKCARMFVSVIERNPKGAHGGLLRVHSRAISPKHQTSEEIPSLVDPSTSHDAPITTVAADNDQTKTEV